MFSCHSELKSFYSKIIFHPIYKILSRTVLERRSLLHTQKLKGTGTVVYIIQTGAALTISGI